MEMDLILLQGEIVTPDGARLHFTRRAAPGPLVVFSHPHSGHSETFAPLLECWHGNALIWDRRGYGGSRHGDDPECSQEDDLMIILEYFSANHPVVLLGVAAGGAVSLSFAAKHPQKVSGLIFVSSFLGQVAGSWFGATAEVPPQGDAAARELSPSFQNDQRADRWREIVAENHRNEAGEPPQPCTPVLQSIETRKDVVIATGEYDLLFTPKMLHHAKTLLPHAQIVVLPDVAHGAPYEDPLGFATWLDLTINRFLVY